MVGHHHERHDGSGYPDGLKGDQIPIGARILTIADSYDAMTSERPYRQAMSAEFAFTEIERCRGTQFDPDIVDAFISNLATPAYFAITQDVVVPKLRATSLALGANLIFLTGGAWGPTVIGSVSELMGGGAPGLTGALLYMVPAGLLAASFFGIGMRYYASDCEGIIDEVLAEE